jgi:hypothetical protein
MNMEFRKIIRDFVSWQIGKDLLKDELTIDYEVAETYLEENEVEILNMYSVINNEVSVSCGNCKWQHAKWEYKCDGCDKSRKNWEQDTDL